MEDNEVVPKPEGPVDEEEQRLLSRRDFLAGLRKWSAAVIGVAVAGSVLLPGKVAASGWINRRGGWINGAGGGGGGWVNRSTGGGGGSWVNRRGY